MSVRNAILAFLSQRPRHGYELHAAFEAIMGGEELWAVKPAQIYTTLTRLEEAHLVCQEGRLQDAGPEKRIYGITDAGRAELARWFLEGVSSEHQRDEFYLKLMLALNTSEANPEKVIRTQRARLYQELHDYTTRRSASNPKSELAQIFLLDKSIMHIEADLRWLDLIEARLDEIKRQPVPELPVKPRGRPKRIR